jgi:hypothetical protein
MNLLLQCSTGKLRGKSQTLRGRKRYLDFEGGNRFNLLECVQIWIFPISRNYYCLKEIVWLINELKCCRVH